MTRSVVGAVGALSLALLAGAASAAWGEEATVRAASAARGQGFFFEIGESRALFLGEIHGVLYVDTEAGALDGASMTCPASFTLDRFRPTFTAEGYCTFAQSDADKIYARWTCTGGQTRGCVGRLKLESGTGRFAGISGEGDLVIRSALAEFTEKAIAPGAGLVVRETASVLVVLPALRYRLP